MASKRTRKRRKTRSNSRKRLGLNNIPAIEGKQMKMFGKFTSATDDKGFYDSTTHSVGGKNVSQFVQQKCNHAGYVTVVTLPNGAVLKGAMEWLVEPTLEVGLLLRCNGLRQTIVSPIVKLPSGYESLRDHVLTVPEIQIDWTDYCTPQLHEKFWIKLYDMLPSKTVICYCQGGHGRTGTAMACLMVASGKYSAVQAINLVRSIYCSSAIEAKSQEDYIASVEAYRDDTNVSDIVQAMDGEIATLVIEDVSDEGIQGRDNPDSYETLSNKVSDGSQCTLCQTEWEHHNWKVCVGAYKDEDGVSQTIEHTTYDMESGAKDLHPTGNTLEYTPACNVCGALAGAEHGGDCYHKVVDEFDPDRPSVNDDGMQTTESMLPGGMS